jgi:hypothetical protein
LRVLQGWVFLSALSQFPFSNFASLPEDVFDLIKGRVAAPQSEKRFWVPHPCGFCKGGSFFCPFPNFHFRISLLYPKMSLTLSKIEELRSAGLLSTLIV